MVRVETLGYVASIFMGLSLGMTGGGGSILTVPILVYLFRVPPVLATGYSLFIVGLTALIGGVNYTRRGEADLKTGANFAIPSFLGVYSSRAYVIPRLPDPVFSVGNTAIPKPLLIMAVFSLFMLAASISMIRGRKDVGTGVSAPHRPAGLIAAIGFVVGLVTGFVGAGGGFLIIPALVLLVGLRMKIAVGTSLVIIATQSLFGFTGDLQHQENAMNWTLLLSLSAISIMGIAIGMKLARKVSERTLKKGFGYFVLVMGLFILFDQARRL
ncbi:MAG: sulfite exporter TauE/SafE family protein [Bdellovibrionales bacterium]